MSTPNNKLKYVFDRALPSFVKEDHEGLVNFLQAYYEFLQQTKAITDVRSLRDIDSTLDEFITYFKSEVGANIPFAEVNERFLLTRLKDVYLSKGTAASFKLLFRILFGKEIVIEYPGRQMLKASDGKWIQDYSIFVEVKAGDPSDLVGKIVDVVTPSKTISLNVLNKQDVELEVNNVIQKSDTVFELFIDRKFFGTFSAGDKLVYKDFIGIVQQSSANLKIKKGGANFRVGQLFSIATPRSTPSIIKVKSVSPTGAITAIEFVKFGFGFLTDFNVKLFPTPVNLKTPTGININGQALDITDEVEGFIDYGYLNKVDYVAVGTWDDTYVGNILREFVDVSYRDAEETEDAAIIEIFLGAVAKYPGYFSDNSGFLSDAIFIQDSNFYQQFSYVIKIDEALEKYKSFVKSILHPAGTAIFGEYALQNEFDLSTDVESILVILFAKLFEELDVEDISTFLFNKGLTESLTGTDSSTLVFDKAVTDSHTETDEATLSFDKRVDDSVEVIDDITKTFQEASEDTSTADDLATMSMSKPLDDIVDEPTDSYSLSFDKVEQDSITEDDVASLLIEKTVEDSVDVTDEVTTKGINPLAEETATADDSATFGVTKLLEDEQIIEEVSTFLFTTSYSEDPIPVTDAQPGILFEKTVEDSVTPSDEITTKEAGVAPTDEILTDDATINFNASVRLEGDDNVLVQESEFSYGGPKGLLEGTEPVTDTHGVEFTKLLEDVLDEPTDAIVDISPERGLTDDMSETTDAVNAVFVGKTLDEDAVTLGSDAFLLLNRTVDPETVLPADSGGFIVFDPYNDADFFGENYTGSRILF